MIRTALLWLGVGFSVGGLVLLAKDVPFWPALWTWRLSHVYMLLLGWMVQLACGVAFWILPRLDAAGSRGNEQLAWLCYGCLNGGVALASLYGPLAAARWPAGGAIWEISDWRWEIRDCSYQLAVSSWQLAHRQRSRFAGNATGWHADRREESAWLCAEDPSLRSG
ncbi:MAG: hypothetical protein MUD01_25235 [Chloroflexaceae bacterium]|nr:hypothetical protein [Chloroflexaceae bacterium]